MYKSTIKHKSQPSFEQIKQFIEENYQNPNLGADMICEMFSIHPVTLSKIFKEKFQVGMVDCIATVRIGKAKMLLLNSNMNISDIYKLVGYTNWKPFARTFKKSEGMSASDYRNINL